MTEKDRDPIALEKRKIRENLLSRLARQKETERSKKSQEISRLLFSSPEFIRARTVMFYVARRDEVDTYPMIREALKLGKRVTVPVVKRETKEMFPSLLTDSDKELEKGPYGVYQPARAHRRPVSLREIDMVVVPGVAFDRQNNRLGRGKGYYDRFLKSLPESVFSVGLAFAFQVRASLPTRPHDVSLHKILSA